MRLSFQQCGETNVDITDVISILASLIDQVGFFLYYRVSHIAFQADDTLRPLHPVLHQGTLGLYADHVGYAKRARHAR